MPFHAKSAGLLLTQRRCAAKCLDSDWFQLSNQVISTLFRFRCVNMYQTTWKCLQSHASWVPTCPNIPSPHSCLHALRRCRFMLIQKWIQKTTAEQHLKYKKEAFNKSPIEIGPKLRRNEMHVNAFGGHVPSKTLTVFESKALISLVLR